MGPYSPSGPLAINPDLVRALYTLQGRKRFQMSF